MADGICSVPTCEKSVACRGWCDMHYSRWKRHGDLETHYRYKGLPAEQECSTCRVLLPASAFYRRGDTIRSACRACENADSLRWREANREKHAALARRWYRENWDRARDNRRRYATKHPEVVRDQSRRRLARKRALPSEPINEVEIFDRDGWVCQLCGKPVEKGEESLDHIIPISLGGPHLKSNVQLAHRRCNSRKGNRLISFLDET